MVYRAGLVGLGAIGAGRETPHVDAVLGEVMPHSHAAAYAALPSVRLTAVCDSDVEMLERFGTAWAHRFQNCKAYTDWHEMLATESLDLLSVALPDNLHADCVVDAARSVRAILCEKPIATTLEDADRMISACQSSGTHLLINYTRRWLPEFRAAAEQLRAGRIGKIHAIVGRLLSDRPMLFRNGTHLIDLICLYAGSRPLRVSAHFAEEFRGYPNHYMGDGGVDPSLDPSVRASIEFSNGVVGFLDVSRGPSMFDLDITGSLGRLHVGSDRNEILVRCGDGLQIVTIGNERYPKSDTLASLAELVALLENQTKKSSSGEDARQVLAVAIAILHSASNAAALTVVRTREDQRSKEG